MSVGWVGEGNETTSRDEMVMLVEVIFGKYWILAGFNVRRGRGCIIVL